MLSSCSLSCIEFISEIALKVVDGEPAADSGVGGGAVVPYEPGFNRSGNSAVNMRLHATTHFT